MAAYDPASFDPASFDALFAGGTPVRRPASALRRRLPAVLGVVALVLIVALALLRPGSVSDRPGEQKTVKVVLPPPPPPPPPEIKPVEPPPVPKPTPIEQPVTDTPPPPVATPQSEPTVGDSALTAREGAGPSNYGLAVGDGGGTRIGGKAGGDNGFAAYAQVALAAIREAAQRDPLLSKGRYTARLAVTVAPDGRITGVRLLASTGDAKRDAAIEQRLAGLQLKAPPAGLPVMRIELNARS